MAYAAGEPLAPYWLTDLRLETAVVIEDDGYGHTETARRALRIEDGRIAEIAESAPDGTEQVDAGGLLGLPSLRDMHTHVDKTFLGGQWRAPKRSADIRERILEERRILPELVSHLEPRAMACLRLLSASGTTQARLHCNVDDIVGASSVHRLAEVRERARPFIDTEIVAFPQHGLQGGAIVPAMRDALSGGADIVGAIDPASAEGDVNQTLETVFSLAADFDAPIDIHLHDPGTLGVYEIERIAAFTHEAGWNGRVTISHAYCLAAVDAETVRRVSDRLAAAQIDITTAPLLGAFLPVPMLLEAGVNVSVGSDSLMDHWEPWGRGDMLEKVDWIAQRFGWIDERALADALTLAIGGGRRYDAGGAALWPAIGDTADIMLVDASCSAEAVARRSPRPRVFRLGREVSHDFHPPTTTKEHK
jgi:cytosine/adenosine deaminase-related metal-dependent hydrolase